MFLPFRIFHFGERNLIKIFKTYIDDEIIHVRYFYHIFFIIFYNAYLEILKLERCFKNCAKSKWEEQKRMEGVQFKKSI